jgi:DNA-binding NarL/FixJ family response regulator
MTPTQISNTFCSNLYYNTFISTTNYKKSNNQTFVKIKAMNKKNKYVFIVDSSMTSANRIFSALGNVANILKVEHAANGKDALQKISINPPNAILLDIQLPDMSGADMLQQIRKNHPGMTIIVLTDYPTPYSFKVCKELGASGYYNKSSELDMVIEHLQKLTK